MLKKRFILDLGMLKNIKLKVRNNKHYLQSRAVDSIKSSKEYFTDYLNKEELEKKYSFLTDETKKGFAIRFHIKKSPYRHKQYYYEIISSFYLINEKEINIKILNYDFNIKAPKGFFFEKGLLQSQKINGNEVVFNDASNDRYAASDLYYDCLSSYSIYLVNEKNIENRYSIKADDFIDIKTLELKNINFDDFIKKAKGYKMRVNKKMVLMELKQAINDTSASAIEIEINSYFKTIITTGNIYDYIKNNIIDYVDKITKYDLKITTEIKISLEIEKNSIITKLDIVIF